MLGKIIKLIIFSRLSKGGLIALLLSNIFMILLIVLLFSHFRPIMPSNIGVIYITAIYTLFAYLGGFPLMKADLDYLFTLPIDRKKLGLALYLSTLIMYLVFVIYLVSFTFSLGAVFVSPFLGISLPSLGIVLQEMRTTYKVPLIVLIALWFLSPLFGFEYSPTSSLFGYIYNSILVTVPYTVLVTVLSIREIGNYDQILMRRVSRTSGIVGHTISFEKSSPFMAVLKLKLAYLPLAGRVGFYTSSGSYKFGAVRMSIIILVTSVLAVAYFVVFSFITSIGVIYESLSILTGYILMFIGFFVPLGNLTNERLWLTVTSIGYKFFRYIIIAIGIQSLIIVLPFAIANIILSIKNPIFLNTGIVFLFYVPLVSMLYFYILANLRPLQLKDEFNPINIEIRGSNFLISIFLMIFLFLMIVMILVPLLFDLIIILTLVILTVFLLRDNMIFKTVNKMTEAGYV